METLSGEILTHGTRSNRNTTLRLCVYEDIVIYNLTGYLFQISMSWIYHQLSNENAPPLKNHNIVNLRKKISMFNSYFSILTLINSMSFSHFYFFHDYFLISINPIFLNFSHSLSTDISIPF